MRAKQKGDRRGRSEIKPAAPTTVRLSAIMFAAIILLVFPKPTRAEAVWTCTAPSVTDGKSTEMRYVIASIDKIIDGFNMKWNIIRNTDNELIAVLPWPIDPNGEANSDGAWILIIDPHTGNMVKTVTHVYDLKYNFFIRGTCVKD